MNLDKLKAAIVKAGSLAAALRNLCDAGLSKEQMAVVVAIAEAESEVMRKRSSKAVDRAKVRPEQIAAIAAGLKAGLPHSEIAAKAGVSRVTVWRHARVQPLKAHASRSTRTVKDFEVRSISHQIAKPFIEQWHYSRKCPTGLNLFFGAYLDGELYAVADYGMGVNMDKGASLARQTKLPVRFQNITQDWLDNPPKNTNVEGLTVGPVNCLELKRLCRQGEKGEAKIPLTRFLSICHRILKREKGISFVVSYSDPGELRAVRVDGKWQINPPVPKPDATGIVKQDTGHLYRAANFQHLGKTAPETHTVDENGVIFHRRIAYKAMKRWNEKSPDNWKSLDEVRKESGRVPILSPPKDRWFIAL